MIVTLMVEIADLPVLCGKRYEEVESCHELRHESSSCCTFAGLTNYIGQQALHACHTHFDIIHLTILEHQTRMSWFHTFGSGREEQ
jgi:hypothetical protein